MSKNYYDFNNGIVKFFKNFLSFGDAISEGLLVRKELFYQTYKYFFLMLLFI